MCLGGGAVTTRVLFLSQMFPLPVQSGTQMRTLQLLQRMGRRFEVTFLTLAADPGFEAHVPELERYCAKVIAVVPDNRRNPGLRAAYKTLYWIRRLAAGESPDHFYNTVPSVNRAIHAELASGRYDILFCEYWFWDQRIFAFSGLKVIDANDVQAVRIQNQLERTKNSVERLLKGRLLARYRQAEAAALARADLVVAITNRDRETFAALLPPRVETLVIPTGLDTDYFVPQAGSEPEPNHLVFYGALANPMNRDAVQFLVQDILPRLRARVPAVRLTLVGAFPQPEHHEMARRDPGIQLTGYVKDVRPPLSRAAVVVCPLRFGYGIRGRIFELLSMNIPVVATPVAVEGMGLASGDGLLLAEGAEALADAVAGLLLDPGRRATLAQRGREIAVRRMSFEATYDKLVEQLERRAGGAGATRSA